MNEAGFAGRRVALLEGRRGAEAAALVRQLGGEPVLAPALREEPLPAGPLVARLLDALAAGQVTTVVLLTGVAVSCLFQEARGLGREAECVTALRAVRLVVRGPKPAAALAPFGLRPTQSAQPPFTTRELVDCLAALPLAGQGVAILHYGELNGPLSAAVTARAARVMDLVLYEWKLPEDTAPLGRLIDGILDGQIDVVAFTSQVQARHLFEVAGPARTDQLRSALNEQTLVGAIGPVCAEVLAELGIASPVVPTQHKLRPFLTALAGTAR